MIFIIDAAAYLLYPFFLRIITAPVMPVTEITKRVVYTKDRRKWLVA